jgi:hypothetical protein
MNPASLAHEETEESYFISSLVKDPFLFSSSFVFTGQQIQIYKLLEYQRHFFSSKNPDC